MITESTREPEVAEPFTGLVQDYTADAVEELRDASDKRLFRLMKSGDSDAFRELFTRYEMRLVAYAEKYLDTVDLAKDVCQEVFLKLISNPPRVLLTDSLAPWLFRVTRNLAIDKQRSRKFEIYDQDAGVNEMTATHDPLQSASMESDAKLVAKLVSELPKELREVVNLRIHGEVAFKDIAATLSIPQGTALWRMHRALEILRKRWKDHVEQV